MHIRFMRRDDIPGVVDVALNGFADDPLFAGLAPRGKLYPNKWRYFNLGDIKFHFLNPDSKVVICVTDLDDAFYDYEKGEEVMGFCTFDLHVSSESLDRKQLIEWKNPNEGLGLQFDRLLNRFPSWWTRFSQQWLSWLHPHLDAEELVYMRSQPNAWEKLPYYIDASILAVSGKFQRKGVASRILRWALNHVKQHDEKTGQHTPMVLHASKMGFELYKRLGYKTVSWSQFTEGSKVEVGPYITPAMIVDPHNVYTDSVDITDEKGRVINAPWKDISKEKTGGGDTKS